MIMIDPVRPSPEASICIAQWTRLLFVLLRIDDHALYGVIARMDSDISRVNCKQSKDFF